MNAVNEAHHKAGRFDPHNGLVEILAGLLILSFGIGILFEIPWLSAILAAVLAPFYSILKGLSSNGGSDQPELAARRTLLGMAILGLIALILGLVFFAIFTSDDLLLGLRSWLRENFQLAFGLFAGVILAATGAILQLGRFYAYAILALILFITSNLFPIALWIPISVLGGVILLAGVFARMRFSQQSAG
jgi:hypothetical protein